LKKCEAATLPNTSESMKGMLTATQKHKAGERLKASPMMFPFYQEGIINWTKAGAAE
jgi:hypothetical protein